MAMENGEWVCIRPSGTEPKLKAYISVNAADRAEASAVEKQIEESLHRIISA